jgi:hypothetical protein
LDGFAVEEFKVAGLLAVGGEFGETREDFVEDETPLLGVACKDLLLETVWGGSTCLRMPMETTRRLSMLWFEITDSLSLGWFSRKIASTARNWRTLMMFSWETVSASWVSNCESRVTQFCKSAEICFVHDMATERVSDGTLSDDPAAIQ